jgi:hypothetical protein
VEIELVSAFRLLSHLVVFYFQTESEIAKTNERTPGKRRWTEFSTSRSLGAASTVAASRVTQPGAEIPFSYAK